MKIVSCPRPSSTHKQANLTATYAAMTALMPCRDTRGSGDGKVQGEFWGQTPYGAVCCWDWKSDVPLTNVTSWSCWAENHRAMDFLQKTFDEYVPPTDGFVGYRRICRGATVSCPVKDLSQPIDIVTNEIPPDLKVIAQAVAEFMGMWMLDVYPNLQNGFPGLDKLKFRVNPN